MNRREFCSVIAAATGVATAGLAAARAVSVRPAPGSAAAVRPYRLIYDRRFLAARLLADESARRGTATTEFDGDVTQLWFHDLGLRWAEDRAPVAGITTPQALFCLEQLARDAWMRVAVRAEHADADLCAGGHCVTGRAADVARVCAALEGGAAWPARLALALSTAAPDDGAAAVQRRLAAGGASAGTVHGARLVSWIIAT
jgi:hypothetical protein